MDKYIDMLNLKRKIDEEKGALDVLKRERRAACEKALEKVRKDCKEFSHLIEELDLSDDVRFDPGICYDGNPYTMSVWKNGVHIKHKEIPSLYGWSICDGRLPWLGLHPEATVIYKFIEKWDVKQVRDLFYKKVEEELNKKRGMIESERAVISNIPQMVRVTEIYSDGKLVSRKEEPM